MTVSTRSMSDKPSPNFCPDASVSEVVSNACVTASKVVFVESLRTSS